MAKKKVFCPNCGEEMVDATFFHCNKCKCVVDRKGRVFDGMKSAMLANLYERSGKEDKADQLAIGKWNIPKTNEEE